MGDLHLCCSSWIHLHAFLVKRMCQKDNILQVRVLLRYPIFIFLSRIKSSTLPVFNMDFSELRRSTCSMLGCAWRCLSLAHLVKARNSLYSAIVWPVLASALKKGPRPLNFPPGDSLNVEAKLPSRTATVALGGVILPDIAWGEHVRAWTIGMNFDQCPV